MAKKNEKLSLEELLEQAIVKEEDRPYEVPGNWVWTRLINILRPMASKKPNQDIFSYIDIDAIDNKNQYINNPKFIAVAEAPSRASREVCAGDTLFSMVRPYLRNIAYVYEEYKDCIASTGFYVCKPTCAVHSRYLFNFLCSEYVINTVTKYMKGDNSPSVRGSEFESCVIPLPPLSEQQRIVNVIESLFEKLDTAKELVQNALDSFENRKAAILHLAFTGELTAKWREENGVSLDEWEENYLGTMLKAMSSKKPNMDDKYFYYIDIDAINNKTQTVENPKKTLVLEAPSRASRGLESNDILFSLVRPYLKNIAFISDELSKCIASTGFYVCRCKETMYPYFLYYLLCSKDTINYYTSLMKGDNSPSIRIEDFKSLQINLPPIEEQKEIVRILDNLLNNEQRAKELCDVMEKIDLMKKAILARAFRGELGTNAPEEESAAQLLKEVLEEKI